jgi:hypothetical protein
MTDEQFTVLCGKLDQIIRLLELQTFMPGEADACTHQNATDLGTMGMRPGERMRCNDCGIMFSIERDELVDEYWERDL